MLLNLTHIDKYFADAAVLKDVTVSVQEGDVIGIVGENGAGKTTLLKTICGEYLADNGEISLARNARIGYLEQNVEMDPNADVYDEMKKAFRPVLDALEEMKQIEHRMAAGEADETLNTRHTECSAIVDAADGYNMDVQIQKVLNGMGFDERSYHKQIAVLSGGEFTRLRLAKLLLLRPEILILDEPTNHLDFITMEWLENYLRAYRGCVLIVSHDRYFLDAICNRIWQVQDREVKAFKGNFSAYLPQKEMADALQQKQHDTDVATAKKLQDYVDRNLVRASTTKMAQSRRKQLEKMVITEAPHAETHSLSFRFEYDIEPYKELIKFQQLSVEAGGKKLLENFTHMVYRGERLVIAGPNGTGKSTLMQVLAGRRKPSGGLVRIGAGAQISFFEQQQSRSESRVIDALWNRYPSFTELDVRSHLAKFGFRGEDVFKPCSGLSGGELARLRLSEMVLERANILLMDEPTNHLDIFTRSTLTDVLCEYTGTLVLVTHDRYLMKALDCPILYIEKGTGTIYKNFDSLMEALSAPQAARDISRAYTDKSNKPGGYGKDRRKAKADLRLKVKKAEEQIEKLSQQIEQIEQDINSVEIATDPDKLREKCEELDRLKPLLDQIYDQWGEDSEQLEALEGDE